MALPQAPIESVQYDENRRGEAVATVELPGLYDGLAPILQGLHFSRYGATSHEYVCETCARDTRHCLGHPGRD